MEGGDPKHQQDLQGTGSSPQVKKCETYMPIISIYFNTILLTGPPQARKWVDWWGFWGQFLHTMVKAARASMQAPCWQQNRLLQVSIGMIMGAVAVYNEYTK